MTPEPTQAHAGEIRSLARVSRAAHGTGASAPQPPRGALAETSAIPSPETRPAHLDRAASQVRGRAQAPAGAAIAVLAGSKASAAIAAAMSEAGLEENIRDACKTFGILRFHVRISKGTTAGLPDDILIGSRGILWRECKNQTYKPTPAQVRTGEALTAIGQDFAIWRPADWLSGRIRLELMAIAGLRMGAA